MLCKSQSPCDLYDKKRQEKIPFIKCLECVASVQYADNTAFCLLLYEMRLAFILVSWNLFAVTLNNFLYGVVSCFSHLINKYCSILLKYLSFLTEHGSICWFTSTLIICPPLLLYQNLPRHSICVSPSCILQTYALSSSPPVTAIELLTGSSDTENTEADNNIDITKKSAIIKMFIAE